MHPKGWSFRWVFVVGPLGRGAPSRWGARNGEEADIEKSDDFSMWQLTPGHKKSFISASPAGPGIVLGGGPKPGIRGARFLDEVPADPGRVVRNENGSYYQTKGGGFQKGAPSPFGYVPLGGTTTVSH